MTEQNNIGSLMEDIVRLEQVAQHLESCLAAIEHAYNTLQTMQPRQQIANAKRRASDMHAQMAGAASPGSIFSPPAATRAEDIAEAKALGAHARQEWRKP